MGLYIVTGPDWEDDSHNEINDDAVAINVQMLGGYLKDDIVKGIILINPEVDVDTPEE